ncbi:2517_t:CDS:2 [Funneliformis geosporum]|nr:2517_t:CDS:2 [Funneliformis geosporum]
MSDESNSKTLLENEMWLQEAIENEHIIYQRYSTFENTESIGHGAMGEVYKATSSWFQKTIALKKFKISSKFTINEIINEIKLHRRVDDLHDNILRFHENQLMLIMEYADGGTLREYLSRNYEKMDWNIKLDFAKQIASAVECLHVHEIVHRDLHSENIFIHKNNVKIGDFGISKCICEETSKLLKGFASIKYTDPEYLKSQNFIRNKKSDIYSLGMLLWEISSGRIPFELNPPDFDMTLKIIYACWNNDINIRPTINQVIIELNDIKINEINEFNIVNASQEHIILNQPLVSYISTIDKNDNAIPEKLQENKLDNKFRIKNIANIREGILKDLTEEFVNQLYFNRNLDKPFEIFKPDWLKEFINKKNIDSKNLLEKMLKYEQNNSYFTSYIGYFYQNGIGTEMDNHKSLEFYHQVASMNFKSEMKNNSLEIINQSIGQYLLAIFYRLGTIVAVDLEKMFEWGIKSARLGNSFAQVNIGTCYKIGYCTAKDDKQAFEWFLKSAESENIDSQYKVAICFRDGKGTKKSINKAIEWLQKSLDNGNDAARKPLRNLKWKKKFNVCKIN